MKSDAVFKRTFNQALTVVGRMKRGERLPSEHTLTEQLAVSRSTVRKTINELEVRGIVQPAPDRVILRRPTAQDRFPGIETIATSDQVEGRFMEWMLRSDLEPGTPINVLELSRQFGVSTTALRDFLIRFMRFGLLEKRPNASWVFKGMTRDFALELFDVREAFELKSAKAFIALPPDHPAWDRLRALRQEHVELAAALNQRFQDFSSLDARFHQLVNDASQNRFMRDFNDVIAFIFHYHYQWNKASERTRNAFAIREHLVYIDALLAGDWKRVSRAAETHLHTARTTLLRSLKAPSADTVDAG